MRMNRMARGVRPGVERPAEHVPAATPKPRRSPSSHELAAVGERRRIVQPKLRVGRVDDPAEREADALAERLVRLRGAPPADVGLPAAHAPSVMRRVSASGGSGAPGAGATLAAEATSGSGRPLRASDRAHLESRLGADLSAVRLHVGPRAANAADALHARAFTIGTDIAFARGEYRPDTASGQRLLSHEAVHAVQQMRAPTSVIRRQEAGGGTSGSSTTAAPGCCGTLAAPSLCSSTPHSCSDGTWIRELMTCLRSIPVPGGVTFAREILADAEREVTFEVIYARQAWQARSAADRTEQAFLEGMRQICARRAAELAVEYAFNLVLRNEAGEPQWDASPGLAAVVRALEAIPPEHRSNRAGRTTPLIFSRRTIHASGSYGIGGETTNSQGEIDIFSSGASTRPYGRSRAIGIPGVSQTIRHEVGHTVEALLSAADREDFKVNVVRWIDYPWHWITRGRPSPTCGPAVTGLAASACTLAAELGISMTATAGETQLTAFIQGVEHTPTDRGGRHYEKSDHFLASYPIANVPQGREFEYARENSGDYFAEVYAFALSAPEWLHTVLPAAQIRWLKGHLFNTSQHVQDVSRALAVGEPYASEFYRRSQFVFTRRQLDLLVTDILTRVTLPAGAQVA